MDRARFRSTDHDPSVSFRRAGQLPTEWTLRYISVDIVGTPQRYLRSSGLNARKAVAPAIVVQRIAKFVDPRAHLRDCSVLQRE